MFSQTNLSAAAIQLVNSAAAIPATPADRLVVDSARERMIVDAASSHAQAGISQLAAATVQQWAETDDLSDGEEGPADRLLAMMVGIVDENKDGELTSDEQAVLDMACNEAWSYMSAKGVSDDDLDAIFNSEDPTVANEAGARVMSFMVDALPDGDEAAADEVDDFAFGPEAQAGVFDAVYKKRFAIRGGKKQVIRKRVAGTVRLSAKQKVAIKKARLRAHSSKAVMKRMKSLRVRRSMGL